MDAKLLTQKSREELIELALSLDEKLQEQDKKIVEQQTKIEQLLEQLNLFRNEKFGNKSESSKDLSILDEAGEIPDENIEEEEEIIVSAHTRKKSNNSGRRPLPEHLPRETRIYDLTEEEKTCNCGSQLTCIGEEKTEQLEIIPAKLYVIEHVAKKYACKACEAVVRQAVKPKQPISKGLAGPGLLAHVIASKFQDHLPLYRLENIFRRLGVDLPRATLSNWVIKSYQLLFPLYELMGKIICSYNVAYADESRLQVLNEPNRKAQTQSYMWCIAGGIKEQFCYVYHYAETRSHEVIMKLLDDFSGYLHCDGYPGYDTYAERVKQERELNVIQVGCWYHCRRKFIEAAKTSKKPGLANWMIKKIQKLAKIEEKAKTNNLSSEEIYHLRRVEAKPILSEIKEWIILHKNHVLPQSLIGKAITYTFNQWEKLNNYLLDSRLENNNNRMERIMKPYATGRKNWMFASSVEGANAAAVLFSFIETCKYHKVDPFHWLKYVLANIHIEGWHTKRVFYTSSFVSN